MKKDAGKYRLRHHQKYALISVYNKKEVETFARGLQKLGYLIISTGGTAAYLQKNRIPVIPIQQITGNPEAFDGRMKTISFAIESGILFDRSKTTHQKQARQLDIKPIDVVVCNLYPFEKNIQNTKVTLQTAVESIDVGGPTMIRAAAKNFAHVLPVVDPGDYQSVLDNFSSNKKNAEFRKHLAAKAFYHLSLYDSQIARYLGEEHFPEEITIPGRKSMRLRYGENPHQQAAMYLDPQATIPLKNLKKLSGRDLSLLNVTDIYAGFEVVRLFKEPAATVIKHNSPCGIAIGSSPKTALQRAIQADPESAFGGIIVLNKTMDLATAKVIGTFKDEQKSNIDIVAVPHLTLEATSYLKTVRKTMGIYTFGRIPLHFHEKFDVKWLGEGFVLQTADENIEQSFANWQTVTHNKPTRLQLKQMQTAWKFISRIHSNSVIVIDPTVPMTRGIGSGQTSRIRSTMIALEQAGIWTKNAILVSDSFFPFDDSVRLAAKYGISVIVQQGGSVNDQLSIKAADELGLIMVFTNRRAFWH
ncbi:bifunctional phosphoribosylaminoimidazolecarboxamide formyltransferase/IMP cyclohydrolase [Candidatus Roizmanbacteria bacterium RIFCSPHIGHO2_12_FULL_41_11]|uniref:Bifunctional purine biosynthesis protein PurH n=1 Tax=Candidatus Roizmanbacteria bacterium RIFCSPHIGHO2_12_FULL_41_11 TaxID=1802052 RepID=A0A1F7I4M9_9BACT|nr:MAG: bifunctional phosphoribosylaminoimidazolecarboxamide formyltransferase/IMP cyclohydrolase [Candidatus Roizmanbacteria bacterium RIFCSPHIGHO2_12_FULL_41_11]